MRPSPWQTVLNGFLVTSFQTSNENSGAVGVKEPENKLVAAVCGKNPGTMLNSLEFTHDMAGHWKCGSP